MWLRYLKRQMILLSLETLVKHQMAHSTSRTATLGMRITTPLWKSKNRLCFSNNCSIETWWASLKFKRWACPQKRWVSWVRIKCKYKTYSSSTSLSRASLLDYSNLYRVLKWRTSCYNNRIRCSTVNCCSNRPQTTTSTHQLKQTLEHLLC